MARTVAPRSGRNRGPYACGRGGLRRPSPARSPPCVGGLRRSAPRSPPRGCWRRASARRRSSGRTRSRPCSSRCRSATGSAGAWPTATRRSRGLVPARARRRAALLAAVPFVAGPFLRVSVDALDERRRPARSSGSLVAVAGAGRGAGAAARRGRAVRGAPAASTRVEEAGASPGGCTRSRRSGSLVGVFLSALAADPARRHAADVPRLRAGARAWSPCSGLRRRSRCSPRRVVAVLLALPVGTVKAAERRPGDLGGARPTYQYARVVEEPDGERRLELNEGQAVHSVYAPGEWLTGDYWDELLVLPFAGGRDAAAARSRSSATPRARSRAPTATTSRARGSTRSRSTAS